MTEKDIITMREIVNEGIEQLVLPNFDLVFKKLDEHSKVLDKHTKILDEHTKILEEHTKLLEENSQEHQQIIRKLDTEIEWRNGTSKRIKQVEIKLGLAK